MYQRRFKGHLLPEDFKLPYHHQTALIIRKSTFWPDITPLLLKDNFINNKDTIKSKQSGCGQ